ncbi:hypothetical protein AB1Y20_000204 [Prymnesium parvum]|uniref:Uncharacterized protein n=1 Tax=Prymnesium parvum TaxID=97485 RepID=A0AB34K5Q0_PRYPA
MERLFASFALLVGFVAFSLPLLFHDTKHLWSAPPPSAEPTPAIPSFPPYQHEDEPSSEFRKAVNEGDLRRLEELVREHGDGLVNKEHWHGNTPIFEAARSGQLGVVEWLVARGAPADATNEWGDSAINEAASMGHFDVAWRLADLGANVSRTPPSGHSSLLLSAVRHRSVSALEQLASRGADLGTRHWNGNTALHEAARTGELELIRWLVSHGADVNATNDSGEGALAEAAVMGHFDAVWELLRAGAAVGGGSQVATLVMAAVRHDQTELLELLHARGVEVGRVAQHGSTALVEAARGNHKLAFDWLLQHGANASAGADEGHGETPLAAAAYAGHFHLVWQLHQAGARLNETNEMGGTPLFPAVYFNDEESVHRLVDAGLEVDHANHRGDTPLQIACGRGHLGLVRFLRRHGASLGPHGKRGDTPLLRAARFRKLEVVEYLLREEHVDVDVANRRGDTALLEAARAGASKVVLELLDRGATLSHRNGRGMTAFLEAADHGHFEVMRLLHERGVDVHAVNNNGENAADLSKWGREAEKITDWLSKLGVVAQHEDEHHIADPHAHGMHHGDGDLHHVQHENPPGADS